MEVDLNRNFGSDRSYRRNVARLATLRELDVCRLIPSAACMLLIVECCTLGMRPSIAQSANIQGGAHEGAYTPKPGSPERKALINALRGPVEKDLKMPVIFVIKHPEVFLRVDGDWAFVGAEYRHQDGSAVKITDAQDASGFSNQVTALLHRVHGRWQVVDHDTGAVDVGWPDWIRKNHAPLDLMSEELRSTTK